MSTKPAAGHGEDVALVVDELYRLNTSNCGIVTPNPVDCGVFADNLAALRQANLALDLPTELRSTEAIMADPNYSATAAVVVDALDAQGIRIAALEGQVGRTLSAIERAGLLLATQGPDGQGRALTPEELSRARTDGILAILEDPDVQKRLIEVQARGFEAALRRIAPLAPGAPPQTPDAAGFQADVKRINEQHDRYRSYILAADATIRLASALTGDPDFAREFGKLVAAAAAANEIVRSASIVSSAISKGQLLTLNAMGAYTGGVTAALSLIAIFADQGGGGDMQAVLDYLDQRFDRIDASLEALTNLNMSMDSKLDALLRGQAMIISMIRANARAIDATRLEVAILDAAVDELRYEVRDLSRLIDLRFLEEQIVQQVRFDAQIAWAREALLAEAIRTLGFWLNPDSGIIARLNAGGFDQASLDAERARRQSVIQVLDLLGGPTFVRTPDIVGADVEGSHRKPAQTMSLLPELAEAVDLIADYLRVKRAPLRNHPTLEYQVAEWPELAAEAEELNSRAFPSITPADFVGLPNPDAFLFVLEPYLTFALALEPDMRMTFGFSDMRRYAADIDRLVASVETSQAASFILMSELPRTLESLSRELSEMRGGGRLFDRPNETMLEYVFLPEDLRTPERFTELPDNEILPQANAFAVELHGNPEALIWLQANSAPYLRRGLDTDVVTHLQMMGRISSSPENWRITAQNAHEAWMRDADEATLLAISLDVLANLRGLYHLHLHGALFEFSREELAFADRFAATSALQLRQADVAAFVALVKSDRQLIEMMHDQELVDFVLDLPEPSEEVADIVPDGVDVERIYATVRYVNTNRTLGWEYGSDESGRRFTFNCSGVDLVGEDWPAILRLEPRFMFPLDRGGRLDPPFVDSGRQNGLGIIKALTCIDLGRAEGRTIIHTVPFSDTRRFPPVQYLQLANASQERTGEFLRASSMVPDGTPLHHFGRNACLVRAEWTESAGTDGADTAAPVATVYRFVVESYESPFLYGSQEQADRMNDIFLTDTDAEIPGPYDRFCEAWGQTLPYGNTWSRKQVGDRHPPIVAASAWVELSDNALLVAPGFRSDVVKILEARRARLQEDVLALISERVQDPIAPAEYMIDSVGFFYPEVSSDQRRSLWRTYRDHGWSSLLAEPLVDRFLLEFPEEAGDVLAVRDFQLSRLDQPMLLRSMSEWGFGDCLYTTNVLAPWGELLALPVPETNTTLVEALRILSSPPGTLSNVALNDLAAETVIRANARFRATMGLAPTFADDRFEQDTGATVDHAVMPAPRSELSGMSYLGIDHAAVIQMIRAEGCEPGHASIMALADLRRLMRSEGVAGN